MTTRILICKKKRKGEREKKRGDWESKKKEKRKVNMYRKKGA